MRPHQNCSQQSPARHIHRSRPTLAFLRCAPQDKNKQRVLHLCVEWPEVTDLMLEKIFGRRGGSAING